MRLVKQIIYGALFLIIIGGLAWGGYYFFLRNPSCFDGKLNQNEEKVDCGGSCVSCALKNPEPLKISSLEVFDNGNGTVSVLGEINNPNSFVGADSLAYSINLRDKSGKIIFTKSGETFIYPAKNRTIIEPGIDIVSLEVDRGEIIIDSATWQEAEKFGEIPEQNLAVENLGTQTIRNIFSIKGSLKNNNSIKLDKVLLKVVLFGKNDLKESASQIAIENLEAFKSKDFIVLIPIKQEVLARIDTSKTKIILEIER